MDMTIIDPEAAKAALKARERLFVDEYLLDLNATKAADRAGYKWAGSMGCRLMQRPAISAAVDAAIADRGRRLGIDSERVLREIAAVAFARLTDAGWWGMRDGKAVVELHDSDELDVATASSISEVKVIGGQHRISQAGKMQALTLLARHLGLLNDRLEVSGPGGGPLEVAPAEPARPTPATESAQVTWLSHLPRGLLGKIQALLDDPAEWPQRAIGHAPDGEAG